MPVYRNTRSSHRRRAAVTPTHSNNIPISQDGKHRHGSAPPPSSPPCFLPRGCPRPRRDCCYTRHSTYSCGHSTSYSVRHCQDAVCRWPSYVYRVIFPRPSLCNVCASVIEANKRAQKRCDYGRVEVKLEDEESKASQNLHKDEEIWNMDKVKEALPQPRTTQLDVQLGLAIRAQSAEAFRELDRYAKHASLNKLKKWEVSADDATFSIE